jgi:thioredoxin-like negative regulator of GroEL
MEDKAQRIVRCPHCGAKNRVPADKPTSSAKCGKCHKSLEAGKEKTDGEPILLRCSECRSKNRVRTDHLEEIFEPQLFAISDGNFEEKVLKSPLPVLVFAMSPTCPTCNLTAPHVDAFARESKGKARVGKLNVQFNPQLASRFDILSVPQFLIFDRGELMETLTGALDTGQFMMKMAKYLY